MANKVFANGMEISCKAAAGKSIACLPDVCMTPPEAPPTPPGVPIPYPNTANASDMTEGSKNVKISGKEVMLKNKSYIKKTMGDEAGSAAKKGVVTSSKGGKAYFNAWSMDVKIEGQNAVRHFDIMTHNHASFPGNSPTWPYIDTMSTGAPAQASKCKAEHAQERAACGPLEQGNSTLAQKRAAFCADTPAAAECRKARACMMTPYRPKRCCQEGDGGVTEQPHHIVEAHGFSASRGVPLPGFPKYELNKGPCVCAEGSRYEKHHGAFHALVGHAESRAVRKAIKQSRNPARAWKYKHAKKAGLDAHEKVFADSNCSRKCLEEQVDNYHKKTVGVSEGSNLRTYDVRETPGQLDPWQQRQSSQVISTMRSQLG